VSSRLRAVLRFAASVRAWWCKGSLAALLVLSASASVRAGGPEFPGGGTRSLGRGGAAMARADDPSVMTRNPALLADLWDDQALLGAHLVLADACFQPTGWYGWGLLTDDVADFGDGPVYVQADEGDAALDGTPLVGFADDPLPKVCYEGPAPFLPQVAFSSKLAPDLGVGLGFFPPDNAGLTQWGNRDGTVDTPDGRRPNPLRFYRSHQNVSFFTLMGGVGYRISDLVRVGLALQWNLAIYEVTSWTTPLAASREYHNDIRTNVFGRDLFIPGFVASVHLKPLDALDVALGFKWSDGVRSKAKLDITSGAFGTSEIFELNDASTGTVDRIGSAIPTTSPNQRGVVDSPPIWVPQLSLGVRYADRLKPAPPMTREAKRAAAGVVEDSMQNERWDIELDVVYYLTSVYDEVTLTNSSAELTLRNLNPDGTVSEIPSSVGKCIEPNLMAVAGEEICPKKARRIRTEQGGKDQITFRVGGDYNVLPGLLALRAGGSYETDGQDVEYLGVLNYMLQRIGVHGGLTLRVAHKTDISLGFAHFIQKDVRLQVSDDADAATYDRRYKTAEYHFEAGAGVPDAMGMGAGGGSFDGNAKVELPNGDSVRTVPGPFYLNGGTFTSAMSVLSLTFAQHF
jgi:hypothetical protein